jgi:hypothetical protein
MRSRVAPGVLVALLVGVVAGAGLVTPTASATSGRCAPGTGVTVVVDFRGGSGSSGVQVACDPNGAGKSGTQVMQEAGFTLSYVSSQPGFVCRINGWPNANRDSCQRTPPTNAYWGLFWSDGSPATWTYSNTGIGGVKVPAGGSIGWRFQNGGSLDRPGAAPNSARTSGGSGGSGGGSGGSGGAGGGSGGSSGGGSGGGSSSGGSSGSTGGSHTGGTTSPSGGAAKPMRSPSATPTAAATTSEHKKPTATASPSARPHQKQKPDHKAGAVAKPHDTKPSADPSQEVAGTPVTQPSALTSPAAASTDDGGGPGTRFVAIGLLGLLAVSAGAVAWRRRGSREAP